ncbi:MAG: hypothetical protein HYS08_08235 [Chlamydiae bacterium]|nr:hypothetical protein [Chlamydiota bacterium]MBI3265437.1 hypothetical protein [Chlamydiota bacterium]
MARFLLKLDLTLDNLLNEIVEKIEDILGEGTPHHLKPESKEKIRKAVHETLSQDMLQSDSCGFSIYCHENLSDVKAPEFDKKSDE